MNQTVDNTFFVVNENVGRSIQILDTVSEYGQLVGIDKWTGDTDRRESDVGRSEDSQQMKKKIILFFK